MITKKDKYRVFCKTRGDLPLFVQPWWLDAVCDKGEWDVCLVEENEKIAGCLPFYITQKLGFRLIQMPLLTPYLGVQYFYQESLAQKSKFDFERRIAARLIEQLPDASYTQIINSPAIENWLPFRWEGFEQATMYTHLLKIKNTGEVYSGFRKNIKRNLKRAAALYEIREIKEVEVFYRINRLTFERQKMRMPYAPEFMKRVDEAGLAQGRRLILGAYDRDGNLQAAGYYVWDNRTAYYLAGGHTGVREAMSGVMWEAIRYFSDKVSVFDFEGSMIEGVAHFFRGFGAQPIPYHHVFKAKNKWIKILKILKA